MRFVYVLHVRFSGVFTLYFHCYVKIPREKRTGISHMVILKCLQ